ncbi:hypothetical protein IU448_16380 [Nocardia flavorosea]|uniref:hypothetical protein n=1 Tax=Nocardia flavorosea TaxID=53429 RepID=UPI001895600B|nr:hypothetical protein [Nocardia flavorosea]MBF6350579.1 hypothetical protein [Nocardia flavorosea]
MADRGTASRTETAGDCGPAGRAHRGGFSAGLFVTGLLALLVSIWALAGPDQWDITSMIPVGWIIVAVAIVTGVALVISPRKRR